MPSPMLQEAHRLCLVNLMIMDNKTTRVRCSHMISMIYNTFRELLACLKNNLKFYYKKSFHLLPNGFQPWQLALIFEQFGFNVP